MIQKIQARGQGIVAEITTSVKGRPFLCGALELELPGFTIAHGDGEFVRAWREGDCYVIEDAGDSWKLHLVAGREFATLIIGGEPLVIAKTGEEVPA